MLLCILEQIFWRLGVQAYKGMFFCDVDGTILPRGQREVSPAFFSLIRKAHERGYLFCISSGRFHRSLLPLFAEVQDLVVFSASNGCKILYKQEHLIPNHGIDSETARTITNTLQSCNAIPLLSGDKAMHLPLASQELQRTKGYLAKGYTNWFTSYEEIDDDVLQITAVVQGEKEELVAQARKLWGSSYHVVTTGTDIFDICPTSKGDSLVAVSDYFGIDRAHTVAFGDEENDIPMLRLAGKGYLMGTAHDKVKIHQFELCHDILQTINSLINE